MDRSLEIRTPESVAFSYELAGLGSRFLALIVDQAIQGAVLIAIVAGLVLAAARVDRHQVAPASSEPVSRSLEIALVVAVIFVVLFGYFIVFEALWNGQTPGKRLVGLRVVRDGGYPIDFGASLIRNLIRVGEQLAFYYLISAISALLSPENKRIGDNAAGTLVVRDARLAQPRILDAKAELAYAPTAYLDGEERGLIKRFLERRGALTAARRAELANRIASRVRNRVPLELGRLDDESLLERL